MINLWPPCGLQSTIVWNFLWLQTPCHIHSCGRLLGHPLWVIWGHMTACGIAGCKGVDTFPVPGVVNLFSKDVVLVPLHLHPPIPIRMWSSHFLASLLAPGFVSLELYCQMDGRALFLIGVLFLFSWLLIKLMVFSYAYWLSEFPILKIPFHFLWLFFSWLINF